LIHPALIRAEVPAVKELHGLSRDDGKKPDGLTLVPWRSGRRATWDITVVYTLVASYVSQSAVQAASAATAASERKSAKYSSLSSSHICCPVAIETLGPLVDEEQHPIKDWQESDALPVASCGLKLDDEAIRVAVALRLGLNLGAPHTCCCGATAGVLGQHSLVCKQAPSKIARHQH